jgi:hypothetical protein
MKRYREGALEILKTLSGRESTKAEEREQTVKFIAGVDLHLGDISRGVDGDSVNTAGRALLTRRTTIRRRWADWDEAYRLQIHRPDSSPEIT